MSAAEYPTLSQKNERIDWIRAKAPLNPVVLVLTGGKNSDPMGLSQQDFDDFHRIWVDELQGRLAHLSTKGKQIVVPDSGHDIPSDRPDTIVKAVRDIRMATSPTFP